MDYYDINGLIIIENEKIKITQINTGHVRFYRTFFDKKEKCLMITDDIGKEKKLLLIVENKNYTTELIKKEVFSNIEKLQKMRINPYIGLGLKIDILTLKNPELIVDLVSEKLKINKAVILDKNRKIDYVYARVIISKLLIDYCQLNLSEIGRVLNKSHCTVIHYKKITRDIRFNPKLKSMFIRCTSIEYLKNLL